jgi:glycosyltransferase 2 family protein
VLSGTVVRYRAYRTRDLTPAEIGVLIALCTLTFTLGTVLLSGVLLLALPELPQRFVAAPRWASMAAGVVMLGSIALYVLGSWLHLRPIKIAGLHVYYPRLAVVARQLLAAPLELIGAAGIIYFALPEASNPGYLVVLGIFLASFSAALLSHAPGSLGVLELVFVTALPNTDPADVLAALIVFRLFYFLIPLAIALVIVLVFEWRQLRKPHSSDGTTFVG